MRKPEQQQGGVDFIRCVESYVILGGRSLLYVRSQSAETVILPSCTDSLTTAYVSVLFSSFCYSSCYSGV